MACIQRGCKEYALTCGDQKCSCGAAHVNHNMTYIDGILQKLGEAGKMPEKFTRLGKNIDILIDRMIADMEQAKTNHQQHIRMHMDKGMRAGSLHSKLVRRETLVRSEATGECFYQMLQELSKEYDMPNPYVFL